KTIGYAIVIRTGLNPIECEGIIKSINHYYGHMEIEEKGSSFFCNVNEIEDIEKQRDNFILLCAEWFSE
ncbi:MAG: hypothetical protein ACYDEX_22735, partial [Mobilitalea sp.]